VLFLNSAIGRVGTFAGGVIGGVGLQLAGWGGWAVLLTLGSLAALLALAALLRALPRPAPLTPTRAVDEVSAAG
jgi:MFS family permease